MTGTVIDVGGFTALITLTPINTFVAASLSFIAAVINNYTWNRVWTFQDKVHSIAKQFPKFLTVSVGGLLLNLFFLWLNIFILGQLLVWIGTVADTQSLPAWALTLSKLGASAIVFSYNFLANRFWTFGGTLKG
jgi:putative flippase GtrA